MAKHDETTDHHHATDHHAGSHAHDTSAPMPSGQGGHDHGHGGHEDMVQDFKKRFFISLVLTIPILALSPMIQHFIGVDWRFDNDLYILFALSTVVFFLDDRQILLFLLLGNAGAARNIGIAFNIGQRRAQFV